MSAVKRLSESAPDGLAIAIDQHGTTTTITLTGEWDLAQQPATRAAIRRALQRRPESVVLDLSPLSFIDSSGLHVAMELHERARNQGVALTIVPGPRGVQRLFGICQLLEVLPFANTGRGD
jgi:anti-sigma B factor antagonist